MKLDYKSKNCRFLGYSESSQADNQPLNHSVDKNDDFDYLREIDDETSALVNDVTLQPDSVAKARLPEVEPKTVCEALAGEYRNEWKDAIIEEVKVHINNGTWDIIDYSPN